jgi:AcrR family transcriptional regulator
MSKSSGATFDKDLTMRRMERAALDLLAEHGILAGLNLREVAEKAGVNRGLVYHYFGSRRALLRSSLRRTFEVTADRLAYPRDPKPVSQVLPQLWRRAVTDYRRRWRIALLLILDRDEIRVSGNWPATKDVIDEARSMGLVVDDVDARTLFAIHWSLVYGYSAIRDRVAHEQGLAPETVDARVEEMLARMYGALDGPATQEPD